MKSYIPCNLLTNLLEPLSLPHLIMHTVFYDKFNQESCESSMLLQMIEEKREVLLCLGKTYGLTDEQTIQCSQELDHLLNLLEWEGAESKSVIFD